MNIRACFRGLFAVALFAAPLYAMPTVVRANGDITGTVTDSTNGQPLQSAEVSLANTSGGIVSNTVTDAFGRFTIHNVVAGSYVLSVHMLGFRPISRPLAVANAAVTSTFAM